MAKMSTKMKQELKAEKAYAKTHKRLYKLSSKDILFSICNYAVFAIFTVICFFPFWYIFINTISSGSAVMRAEVVFLPKDLTLMNYTTIIKVGDITTALWVTVARTLIATSIMVVASGLVGYLVTKQQLWGRKVWYRMLVITMYFNAGIIPWYLNMSMLGLTNTFMAYIIPGIVAPYNIILVKTYIESIPAEMEESAFIDGAGYMTIFRKIIWPLSKPILATIAIFGAVGNWNSFVDSMMLMNSAPNLYTLQYRLWLYMSTTTNLQSAFNLSGSQAAAALQDALQTSVLKYTVAMITIIPILIVYPFMQRYFEEGIMLGAVKG